MNIAILGGCFNPPHFGHIYITEQVKKLCPVDKIWYMPVYSHPFDKKIIAVNHRFKMAKLLENEYASVSTYEIDKQSVSYTIDTLIGLNKQYPQDTFFWIIGSDQFESIQKWKEWKKLTSQYNFIVIPRPPFDTDIPHYICKSLQIVSLPSNITVLDTSFYKPNLLSSTKVRTAIKNNTSIHDMVPQLVEKYIYQHSLYE